MEPASLVPGLRIDNRYELVSRLGDGTFGEVWRASDTRLNARPVAVKLLKSEFLDRPDMVARFESEADALSRLAHPNVVSVLDRGLHGASRFIVTELVDGRTLTAWLDDARRANALPPLETVRTVFDQVCAAVEAAHLVEVPGPIVHRDLKPDNVLVRQLPSGELHAKVLDFGIAQLGGRRGTSTGMLLGTPLYMAPEQAMGQVQGVGPWTDVFALAVLLVELLTLRPTPGGEETWWAVTLRANGQVLPSLAAMRGDVPQGVWGVVAQALQPDGRQRPGNGAMFRAALRSAWGNGAASSASAQGMPRTVAMGAFTPSFQGTTPTPNPYGHTAAWNPGTNATGPTGTVGVMASGGAAAPSPAWQQQPHHVGGRVPTAHGAPNDNAFTGLVIGALALALVVASGAWFAMRVRDDHRSERSVDASTLAQPEGLPPPTPAPTPTPTPPPTRPTRPEDDPNVVYTIPDYVGSPAWGPLTAPVTMVQVSDFQCPFCSRVEATVARLKERYPNQLRIVWRNYPLPFHNNAMPAAEAAREAWRQRGDEGFWRMHALLFQNQTRLGAEDLARYADEVGLNMSRFRSAMTHHTHQEWVRGDMAAITAIRGSIGTPTFFINGRQLRGAQPYERFVEAIDRALAEAR